jgi:hypothetical protein
MFFMTIKVRNVVHVRSIFRSPSEPVLMRGELALGAMPGQNLPREIYGLFNVHLMTVTILRTLEQRDLIRFLLRDGLAAKEIPGRLSQVSGTDAMKKTQVFYWVREIRAGREDLSNVARRGRPC